jgi:hypothetical protein
VGTDADGRLRRTRADDAARVFATDEEKIHEFRDPGYPGHVRDAGANELADVLSSQRTWAVLTLCAGLRNTVHGASCAITGTTDYFRPLTLIEVAASDSAAALEAVTALGDPAERGFKATGSTLRFEPYEFVSAVTEDAFRVIAAIAEATDVRLFFKGVVPAGYSTRENAARDESFSPAIMESIGLLG